MTCMTPPRQDGLGEPSGSDPSDASDPVAAVEAALGAFRGRGLGGPFGPGPLGPGFSGPGSFSRGRGRGTGADASEPQAGHDRHGGPFGDQAHHAHHEHGGRGRHGGHSSHGGPGGRGGHAAMRLLIVLANHGPSSVSDLAAAIGVDQPRASRLVQAAVDAGQVRREVDPADARRSILMITEAGRAALSAVIDHRRNAIEQALAEFSPDERAEFARLFTRFARAWGRG